MSQIFVSHIEEEQAVAEEIARGLEEAGYSVWYYERDSYPGPSYLYQIDNAISECQVVLVLISRKSVSSQQIKKEIEWAADKYKQFVPVLHGISWEEFQGERLPWRMALGIAVGVPILQGGVSAILPRIVKGLERLGVQSTQPDSPNKRPASPDLSVKPGTSLEQQVWTTQPDTDTPSDQNLEVPPLPSSVRELRTLEGHADAVNGLAFKGDGRIVISASRDGTLKVWDWVGGSELRTLDSHSYGVWCVSLSGDGRLAAFGLDDNEMSLKVWEVDSGRELRILRGHAGWVLGVAVTREGQLAVSASHDGTLKIWDLGTACELHTLNGHTAAVASVAVSGDSRLAISASQDTTLKVWEVECGRELRTLKGHGDTVCGVALNGDGRVAVSASWDKTLKVWEVASGRELRTLRGHTNAVSAVALSLDGRLVVSASQDKTLKLWESASGRQLASFSADAELNCCALSPDGKAIAVGDADGVIHLLQFE